MDSLSWQTLSFEELTPKMLYQIMRLRSEVFVVEQNCPYLDADDKDQRCLHLAGWSNNVLVAYARLLPPGLSYNEPSIGRVCTASQFRRIGSGKLLMQKAIDLVKNHYPAQGIKIGAQTYLFRFYTSFGFQQFGKEYLEDGIPHIAMILPA